ncbi:MAG TPA: MFS transporter, partial [Acidimicrobiia bacterium]
MTPSPSKLSPDFWRLWWAAATSNIGDGIRVTALPLLMATITRDPVIVSGVTAATLAPWILFSLPGGAIVDRANRRTLMIAGQAVRALFVTVLAVAVAMGWESVLLIYATAFVIGTGEVFVDTSLQASIPMLVDETQLEDANGKLLAVEFVTNDALGGPVGAWLFATAAFLPFGFDAVTFLLAAFLIT